MSTAAKIIGRTCSTCMTLKPEAEFFVDKRRSGAGSMRAKCKACTADEIKTKRSENPLHFRQMEMRSKRKRKPHMGEHRRLLQRTKVIKQKYGLTIEAVTAMLAAQSGGCAICLTAIVISVAGRGARTVACVDHDHGTGRIRGLLCNACNTAIGLLGDDEGGLMRALNYLRAAK